MQIARIMPSGFDLKVDGLKKKRLFLEAKALRFGLLTVMCFV